MLAYAQGVPEIKELVNESLSRLHLPADISLLNSTLGRTFCRSLESVTTVKRMKKTFEDFSARIKAGNTTTFNPEK